MLDLIILILMLIIKVIYSRHLACLGRLVLDLYILVLAAICSSAVNRCSDLGGGIFQNFGA